MELYACCLKRGIDFIIAFIVCIIISPIILIVFVWLYFANKGAGAFFVQERPGKENQIFKVIKFKTMTDEKDLEGNILMKNV